ncbi:MAG: zinc-ribbon domain-containing protein [Pyrinomonadaceae bacterium]
MFCPSCGKQTPDESAFCLHCGNRIVAPVPPPQPVAPAPQPIIVKQPPKKSNSGLIVLLILIIGGVGLVGLISAVRVTHDVAYSGSTYNPSSASQVLTSRHNIVNSSFPVEALHYSYYTFTVPSAAHVTGNFRASGGRNDIEVVIFDEEGFENFQNGNKASRVYYNSHGYVTTATIDKNIGAGTYYIIFNNKDAILTDKMVTANIDVEY